MIEAKSNKGVTTVKADDFLIPTFVTPAPFYYADKLLPKGGYILSLGMTVPLFFCPLGAY
jgi:hypothetical protein